MSEVTEKNSYKESWVKRIFSKTLLFGFLYVFSYALSFPFVIPGQKETFILHDLFGNYIVFLVFPFLYLFLEQFRRLKYKLIFGTVAATIASFSVFYWAFFAIHVFGGVGLPATLGLIFLMMAGEGFFFWTPFIYLYHKLQTVGKAYPFLLAGIFTIVEATRNFFPVDFFWAAIGHSQYNNPFFLQFAAIGSNYILTFLIVWSSTLIFQWIRGNKRKTEAIVLALFFVTLSTYSIYKLHMFDQEKPVSHFKAALMQPNINQFDVNQKRFMTFDSIVQKMTSMVNSLEKDTDLVVWHEAAMPVRIGKGFDNFNYLWNKYFPDAHQFNKMIIGLDIVDRQKKQWFNTGGFIQDGKIDSVYYKIKLAPFGEYLPWASLLHGIGFSTIVPNSVGSFSRGTEYTVHDYGFAKASMLICYDGTFSENVRNFVKNGANLFVSITNDAWFGYSSAAFQHLSFYPFRAVETGRTIIRSANVGISGMILPDGSVHHQTGLFEEKIVTVEVPVYEIETPYLLYGNFFLYTILIITFSLLLWIYYETKYCKS